MRPGIKGEDIVPLFNIKFFGYMKNTNNLRDYIRFVYLKSCVIHELFIISISSNSYLMYDRNDVWKNNPLEMFSKIRVDWILDFFHWNPYYTLNKFRWINFVIYALNLGSTDKGSVIKKEMGDIRVDGVQMTVYVLQTIYRCNEFFFRRYVRSY